MYGIGVFWFVILHIPVFNFYVVCFWLVYFCYILVVILKYQYSFYELCAVFVLFDCILCYSLCEFLGSIFNSNHDELQAGN